MKWKYCEIYAKLNWYLQGSQDKVSIDMECKQGSNKDERSRNGLKKKHKFGGGRDVDR